MTSARALRQLHTRLRSEGLPVEPVQGLRATLGMLGPLLALGPLGHPEVFFASLTAYALELVELDAPYRQRAVALVAATALLAAMVVLGTLAAAPGLACLPLVAAVAGVAGLARTLGPVASRMGLMAGIHFTLAFGVHEPPATIPRELLYTLVGGAWACALSLSPALLAPQAPLLRTAAFAWQSAADLLAEQVRGRLGRSGEVEREFRFRSREALLRQALTRALSRLTSRESGDPLRQVLWPVYRDASRFGAQVVALEPVLPRLGHEGRRLPALHAALRSLEEAARALAVCVEHGGRSRERVRLSAALTSASLTVEGALREGQAHDGHVRLEAGLRALLAHLQSAARCLEALPASLQQARGEVLHPRATVQGVLCGLARAWANPTARGFALRIALAATVAAALAVGLQVPRGYWMLLTVLVVLVPDFAGTLQVGLQRIAGTTLGAAVATLLVRGLDERLLLAAVGATCFGFVTLRKRYAVVSAFLLTLMVVLLGALTQPGVRGQDVALWRLGSTVAGGALAIGAGYLLWPHWERQALPQLLAAALRTNADYLERMLAALQDASRLPQVPPARAEAEAADARASESFARMLYEPPPQRSGWDAGLAAVTSLHRLTRQLTGVAVELPHLAGTGVDEALRGRAAALAQELRRLAEALQARGLCATRQPRPPEEPAAPPSPGEPLLAEQLRLASREVQRLARLVAPVPAGA